MARLYTSYDSVTQFVSSYAVLNLYVYMMAYMYRYFCNFLVIRQVYFCLRALSYLQYSYNTQTSVWYQVVSLTSFSY
jgi:hypothetical protein